MSKCLSNPNKINAVVGLHDLECKDMKSFCLSNVYEQVHSPQQTAGERVEWIMCSMEAHACAVYGSV